ncbi:hypothetical protein C8R46DRAFT_1347774, partial [Mycena filopes]
MHFTMSRKSESRQYDTGSAQDIYSSQLLSAGRGTALYGAEPISRPGQGRTALFIAAGVGDVGFIERSQFVPIFRATERHVFPEVKDRFLAEFVPIEAGFGFCPGFQKQPRLMQTHSALVKAGTVMRFARTGSEAAALVTKYRVWHSDVVDDAPFAAYIVKNYKSWTDLCRTHQGRTDLMLVTGVDLTTYYAGFYFTEPRFRGEPRIPSVDLTVTDSAIQERVFQQDREYPDWVEFSPRLNSLAAPVERMAPDAESDEYLQLLEDQHETIAKSSVFIRALRFRHRKVFPVDLYYREHPFLSQFSSAKVFQEPDPLHPLSEYIFAHSAAWYALYGDNDIKAMIGDLRPDEDLRTLLERHRPSRQAFRCV